MAAERAERWATGAPMKALAPTFSLIQVKAMTHHMSEKEVRQPATFEKGPECSGVWRLVSGVWRSVSGVRRPECGITNLTSGI